MVREVMDKRTMGMLGARLPASPAKHRVAIVAAARSVAACLTPGLPPLLHTSIRPRGNTLSRIMFMPQVTNLFPRVSPQSPCKRH